MLMAPAAGTLFPPPGPALSRLWQAQHCAVPTFLLPDELEKTEGS